MPMKVREIIRLLEGQGQPPSLKHPEQPYVITVPGNEGKEPAPGTLNARLKKAGLK